MKISCSQLSLTARHLQPVVTYSLLSLLARFQPVATWGTNTGGALVKLVTYSDNGWVSRKLNLWTNGTHLLTFRERPRRFVTSQTSDIDIYIYVYFTKVSPDFSTPVSVLQATINTEVRKFGHKWSYTTTTDMYLSFKNWNPHVGIQQWSFSCYKAVKKKQSYVLWQVYWCH